MQKFFLKKKLGAMALFVIVCLIACNKDHSEIIDQKVWESVHRFRVKKSAENREILLREAEKIVDSLLLEEARAGVIDSLSKAKPQKPLKPLPILPIDSEEVKPLFDSGLGIKKPSKQ